MSAQPDLFSGGWDERAHARRTDPATSHEAAAHAKVSATDAAILDLLRRSPGGATSREIADRLGRCLTVVSPRFRPLARRGLIRDSGRKSDDTTGHRKIIWEIARA